MPINLRNALMGGKRLPYDAEVEYLEGTGTQWISTGVDYWADFEITCRTVSNSTVYVIGNGSRSSLSILTGSPNATLHFGNTNRSFTRIATEAGAWHTLRWKNDEIFVDGIFAETFAKDESIVGDVRVFGAGGSVGYPVQVSALKLWDTNGKLILDGFSVRKGTVGYLYDRVSGKLFGNAGTGDFVLGPDVVPVEWLQTDGAAYIDTGLEMADGHEVRAEHYFKRSTTRQLMGSNGSRQYYGVSADGYVEFGLLGTSKSTVSVDEAKKYLISYAAANRNNTGSIYDGSTLLWSSSGAYNGFSNSFEIFRLRGLTGFPFVSGNKIVTFKHLVNGAAIQNLISVRVGTDATSWDGAMMDVLTRRIYRNAGTGAFGYGNDLKYPIPSA